jgi:two-component system phosphate regulon sensor histidine kinase PhoR
VTDLKHLERVRQDFVANVSHELRTPLTAIKGYVEALRDGGLQDPAQAKQFLGVIQRHSERMDEIVSDLLLFVRNGISGPGPAERRPESSGSHPDCRGSGRLHG